MSNKGELLDAMVDSVFEEIDLPASQTPWQEAIRRRSESARQVLVRHPWAIGLMELRTSPGPANPYDTEKQLLPGCARQVSRS